MRESKDVQDFKFKRIRKLRIFSTPTDPSHSEVINLLAISNLYDLIFVGFPQGFKVFKTEDILSLEHEDDKNINRTEAETYNSKEIFLSAQPIHLALSCDELTLAVCARKGDDYHAYMFDIRAFFVNDPTSIEPFTSIRLTSNSSVFLIDLIWNPAVNNTLALCLSDGTVSIYDVNEKSISIVGSVKSDATAVCWSPKGKQLIVGKSDGEMIQYKPNLQAVKSIPAPNIFENSCSVANVLWLSSFSFAAAYTFPNASEEGIINLVIVDTPKNAAVVYTPFEDICFSTSNEHIVRYLMIQQPEWKILLCVSRNAMEVGIMSCSAQNIWEQWLPDDSGRAELPLDGNNEMYPIGMAINYNSTREISIDQHLILQPMPILFLLSTKGILCPFHVINAAKNAPNLQKRPQIPSTEGQRFGSGRILGSKPQKIEITQPQASSPVTNVPTTVGKAMPLFGLPIGQIEANSRRSITSGTAVTPSQTAISTNATALQLLSNTALNQPKGPAVNIPSNVPTSRFGVLPNVPNVTISPIMPSADSSALKSPAITTSSQASAFQPPPLIHKRSNPTSVGKEAAATESKPSVSESLSTKSVQEAKGTLLSKSIYRTCILEEISCFRKELFELKSKTANLKICADQSVLIKLKGDLVTMEKFSKDIKATSLSLNQDIHSLKLHLLETFAMLEEAISLQNRNMDPRYRQLLRSRSLDPHKIRKMKEIRSLYHYIHSQINEVHNKLDEIRFQGKKKPKASNYYLPTSETIYQSVCNMQNIIENTSFKLNHLQELMEEVQVKGYTPYSKALVNLTYKTKSGDSTVMKLSDCFHQSCLVSESPPMFKNKKINPEREALLREMLEHRLVTPIRSSAPGSVSRLTIPESVLNASRVKEKIDTVAVPAVANDTFAHPVLTSTPIPNAFRPLRATLHPSASIPTPTAPPSAMAVSRSPLSLPTAEKTPQIETKLEVKADTVNIASNPPKFSTVGFQSPTTTNDQLFTLGSTGTGFMFGGKFNVPRTGISFGSTKVSASAPNSSLPLFTLGTKTVPDFQFKPVESKTSNFKFGENAANENLFQTFGQLMKDKAVENADKLERVIATSVKAKLKTNEEEIGFMVETVLEDVTPPSTSTEDEDEDDDEDDDEEDDEEEEEEDDDGVDDGEGGDDELEGVVIEEIFENDEADEKSSAETVAEVIEVKTPDVVPQITLEKIDDSTIKDKFKPSTIIPISIGTQEKSAIEVGNKSPSEISEKLFSSSVTITPVDPKSNQTSPARNLSGGENVSVTVTPITTNQTSTSSNPGSAASTFSFRQTTSPSTTEAAPFKLNAFQSQTAFKFKPGSQPSIFGGTPAVSSPSIISFGELTPSIATTTPPAADSIQTSGALKPATTTFGSSSTFGTPVTGTFGTTTATTTSSFGLTKTTAAPFGSFGTPATSSQVFKSQTTTATTPAFGSFGVSATTAPAFGAQTTTTPAFGTLTSTASAFGNTTSVAPAFGTTAAPAFGTAVFGQKPGFGQTFGGAPVFGQPVQPIFGQTGSSSFGNQPTSPSTFGQTGGSLFGQNQNPTSTFGSSGFGQGGFFSGLGAKPSAENANRNVFGERSSFGAPSSTSLFGNQPQSNFGTADGGGGSFSSNCTSVAAAGFGGFHSQQQNQQPQQTPPKIGGFGSAPAFGGGPIFGGSPGSPPAFGSSGTFTAFGNTSQGFGALGSSQQQTTSFGSLAQQGGSLFGNQSFGAGPFSQPQQQQPQPPPQSPPTSFGGNASFGSPGSGGNPASSFSQWR